MALEEPIPIHKQRWKMELVRVADLRIDPRYHDPSRYSEKRAISMAANFNPEALGTITVSHRSDGSLIVVDGNHRVAACRIAGEEYIPAKVFYDLTLEEEAGLFRELSEAVRLTTYALFRARLVALDPVAVAIFKICEYHDVTIVGGAQAQSFPGRTRAVGVLEKIYNAGLLDQTLLTCREAWPEDIRALDAIPLAGVSSFIWGYKTHPKFSTRRLIKKLSEESASALIRKAKDAAASGSSFGITTSTGGGRYSTGGSDRRGTAIGGVGSFKAARQAVLARYNAHMSLKLDDLTSSQIHRLSVLKQDIWAGLMEDK